ncbi:uncharacterized protein CCOS01_03748 [Colletotrichum costaricense]|uniref:Uncharacterized protein n=2 Tax=Colletotrichum acutatum species complex TaxID=2707335 RepID=A0AAJ0E5H2_9PEZI|nr:uncharacterized protein CCOS01_03748 [Colletotrichum costaricense]XP_060374106.1 uncharacterized protein CTAM01_15323 [Colletotrichum tamarilloi]KAK1476842.1 hypothetical protein CTAM01_15323 [Colletotrichum tamarilloi]KAK1534996.1 hypothetical protein CCOS01_03748 [Colletotrichum costaricense]
MESNMPYGTPGHSGKRWVESSNADRSPKRPRLNINTSGNGPNTRSVTSPIPLSPATDILSIYRRGPYVPQGGTGSQIQPVPNFLQLNPIQSNRPSSSLPVTLPPLRSIIANNFQYADNQACRTCPQCSETILGPEPIGTNGRPVSTVCENCRQGNVREQVLRNIAAEALLLLNTGVVPTRDNTGEASVAPVSPPKQDDSHRLSQEYQQFQPYRPLLCVRCKRPGVPCAPGRRRCAECICILVAFGPDDGSGFQKGNSQPNPFRNVPLSSQNLTRPPIPCDVCHVKTVPPGTKRCEDCIAPDTPNTPLTAFFTAQGICVICERNHVVQGKSHCRKCLFEGTTSAEPLQALQSLPAAEIMQCTGCGHQVHRTTEGYCRECRDNMPGGSGNKSQGGAMDVDDEPAEAVSSTGILTRTKCGCQKNFARLGKKLCADCLAAKHMVGWRGWTAWRKTHWPRPGRTNKKH